MRSRVHCVAPFLASALFPLSCCGLAACPCSRLPICSSVGMGLVRVADLRRSLGSSGWLCGAAGWWCCGSVSGLPGLASRGWSFPFPSPTLLPLCSPLPPRFSFLLPFPPPRVHSFQVHFIFVADGHLDCRRSILLALLLSCCRLWYHVSVNMGTSAGCAFMFLSHLRFVLGSSAVRTAFLLHLHWVPLRSYCSP